MVYLANLFPRLLVVTSVWGLVSAQQQARSSVCTSPNNIFHVQVDIFSSTLGLYRFAECGDLVNPTLGLRRGENYTFVQADRTNYFHPFGIHGTQNVFYEGQKVIEKDDYEQAFHSPPNLWAAHDDFSVQMRFDDPVVTQTTFYCIVHHGMEGRIQILPPESEEESTQVTTLASGASNFVDIRSDVDKKCGTTGLNDFQLPNQLCPNRFVCGTELVSPELKEFSDCLEAANCAMMSGMTTGVQATADSALFIHQMIPHHENAVNTAKTLLKTGNLLCPDLTDSKNSDCLLEGILLDIVANHNHQIQRMQSFLETRQYPLTDNCNVYVKTLSQNELLDDFQSASMGDGNTPSGSSSNRWNLLFGTVLSLLVSLLWTLGH